MASAANSQHSTARAGQVLSHKALMQRLDRRRDGDGEIRSGAADKIIQRYLDRGGAVAGKIVNQYNKTDSPYLSDYERFWGPSSGANPSADLAGMANAKVGKGDVYLGSTAIEVPAVSSRDVNSGASYTPGRTEYARTILPRWMVKGAAGGATAADEDAGGSMAKATAEPGADLLAAREAYERANAYGQESSTSVKLPDLTKTGGELYNEIQGAGQSQLDDYQQRFIPKLLANANLTAQEIGYAGQQAIANLPDNLNLPEYDKVFPKRATDKKGIYKWLEERIKNA